MDKIELLKADLVAHLADRWDIHADYERLHIHKTIDRIVSLGLLGSVPDVDSLRNEYIHGEQDAAERLALMFEHYGYERAAKDIRDAAGKWPQLPAPEKIDGVQEALQTLSDLEQHTDAGRLYPAAFETIKRALIQAGAKE